MFGVRDRRSRDVGGGHAQVREPLPRLAHWGVSCHAGSHREPSSVDPESPPGKPSPETREPKPETRSPKPETRNPKPETRNPKRFLEVFEGGMSVVQRRRTSRVETLLREGGSISYEARPSPSFDANAAHPLLKTVGLCFA